MTDADDARREVAVRRPTARAAVVVGALVVLLVVAVLPSPYVIERPGPVFDTLGTTRIGGRAVDVVSIPGRTVYPATGTLDALTVSLVGTPSSGPSWVDLAAAWLDPTQSVVPLEEVYPPRTTQKEADEEGASEMTDSQQSAIAAALGHLGEHVTSTVTVTDVLPRTAAAGVLRAGDVVQSYAGRPVESSCALQDAVQGGGAGTAAMVVRRDGRTERLTVTPRRTAASGGLPLVGIVTSTRYRFPVTVSLRLGDVGGPSAGLMFTLGIIDKLTPGSLTGGAHVAGTGTICPDGTVGPIGGIAQKMAGARQAGASVFLAPESNCSDVVGHVPGGLHVFAVRRLSDALAVLTRLAGRRSTAGLPTCSPQVESRS